MGFTDQSEPMIYSPQLRLRTSLTVCGVLLAPNHTAAAALRRANGFTLATWASEFHAVQVQ